MNIWRAVSVSTFSVMLMACACSKKLSSTGDGAGGSGMPLAEDGGPLKDINFAFDSSSLSAAAQSTLRENAKYLLDNPSALTTVEGHCDERGTNEYNMALGERRSKSSEKYLVGQGIAASRLSSVSYGEEMPLVNEHNEAAWAKNRRVHFRVGK